MSTAQQELSIVGQDTAVADRYRDIPGFPGYRVFDDGTVWTCKAAGRAKNPLTENWRPLKPGIRNGYQSVCLSNGGCRQCVYVHRLVLELFVGPCPEGKQCAHENGIRTDCGLKNLSWKTQVENEKDKIRHGTFRVGERHGNAKLTAGDVREIRAMRASGAKLTDIADRFGIFFTNVAAICDRRSWNHIDD